MTSPSIAWLLVVILVLLLISQNAELDFSQFSCSPQTIRQFYDVLGFLFGHLTSVDFLSAANTNTVNEVLKLCGAQEGDHVLEFGFGSGLLAQALLDRVGVQRYAGVELSEAMVNVTSHRVSDTARRRMLLLYSDDPVTLLSSTEALHSYSRAYTLSVLDALSVDEIDRFLSVMHARLRPGGLLCVSAFIDLPDHIFVRLYKAAWRIAPLLLGGRRPLLLRRFISEGLWAVKDAWLDQTSWLPSEFLVLERRLLDGEAESLALMEEGNRVSALRRWADHIDRGVPSTSVEGGVTMSERQLAASSASKMPLGVLKDIVAVWLPDLSNSTMLNLVRHDIQNMTQEEIITAHRNSLQQLPAVGVTQMVHTYVASLDAKSLEDWLSPPIDHLNLEELRMHVVDALDSVSRDAQADATLLGELLRRKDAAAKMQSRSELLDVNRWLEREVLVPASEMSREQLESIVLENMNHLTRQELEDFLLSQYQVVEGETVTVLHEDLLEDLHHMSIDELQARAYEAVRHVNASSLLPAVLEVATDLLTDEDLAILMGTSSAVNASRVEGVHKVSGAIPPRSLAARRLPRDDTTGLVMDTSSQERAVEQSRGQQRQNLESAAGPAAGAASRIMAPSEERHIEL